jgi:sugar O-acyltransferase (sialic acid O-acetyltransferase NeuD family)
MARGTRCKPAKQRFARSSHLMRRIGIFGTSGMAREAGDIAWDLGWEPVYVAFDQAEMDACSFPGEFILESDSERYRDMGYVIGIGNNAIRQRIAKRHGGGLRFANLIHPSATFGRGQREKIEHRQGNIVCAGVRFTNNILIGNFCIFNLNSTISHDVVIQDYVYVAPGAHITGNIHIESQVWIGVGVAINQGNESLKLRIGAGATIGSGAVVLKDCEPNAIYVGVPAMKIK